MSAFTDVLANIIRTVDGKHDLGAGELAERIEVELAKAGIVITQLPARSGDPFRARDIVIRAAKMREKDQRDKGVKKPFEWWQCTDAQKVHWILAAAASIPTKETPK